MSRNLEHLYPPFRERAEAMLADLKHWVSVHRPGAEVLVTWTYRSQKEQDEIYAQGRTKPGPKLTNSKRSLHTDCLALDLVLERGDDLLWSDDEFWAYYGHSCRKAGIDWGGDWKSFIDRPHCQMADAISHQAAARRWRKKAGL